MIHTTKWWKKTDVSYNGITIKGSLIVLDLAPNERSWKKIKIAFRIMSSKYHPDHYYNTPELEKECTLICQELCKSYSFLKSQKTHFKA